MFSKKKTANFNKHNEISIRKQKLSLDKQKNNFT